MAVFTAAGVLLAVILLVVLLPRGGRNGRHRSELFGSPNSEEFG
jgi:hypothetical protein